MSIKNKLDGPKKKKKKAWWVRVLDFTLTQEWNRRKENWQDYMNKLYVPKCSYKWSHLITSTQNFLATELHPHCETSDSLPRILSSFGISWCPLGKITSCELLNQELIGPTWLQTTCVPVLLLQQTAHFCSAPDICAPMLWKGSFLWVLLSEMPP